MQSPNSGGLYCGTSASRNYTQESSLPVWLCVRVTKEESVRGLEERKGEEPALRSPLQPDTLSRPAGSPCCRAGPPAPRISAASPTSGSHVYIALRGRLQPLRQVAGVTEVEVARSPAAATLPRFRSYRGS